MIQINTKYPYFGCIESRIGGRIENQDSAGYADTPYGLLVVVCDGMGGGPGGKTASATTVQIVIDLVRESDPGYTTPKEALSQAVIAANEAISEITSIDPSLKGMGTTIAAIIFTGKEAVVAHVGDSRVYKLRHLLPLGSHCEKIFRTADHSMVGQMVRDGLLTEEQARLSANTNIITRAIGANSNSEATIDIVPYEKGDRFMICTDGIWGVMPEKELMRMVCMRKPVSIVTEKIANLADKYGAAAGGHHDNLTIAVIETKKDSKREEKMNRKAKQLLGVAALALFICIVTIIALLINRNSNSSYDEPINTSQDLLKIKDEQIDSLNDCIKRMEDELNDVNSRKALSENETRIQPVSDQQQTPNYDETRKKIVAIIDEILKIEEKKAKECQKKIDEKLKQLKKLISDTDESSFTEEQVKAIKEIEKIKTLSADQVKNGKSTLTGAHKNLLNNLKKRL